GRTLSRKPSSRLIGYTQRDSSGLWVRVMDPVTGTSEALIRLTRTNEYFAWTPEGDLLTASGNRLLRWRRGDSDWIEVATFTEAGLQNITRLAVSPDGSRLALVGAEPAPPRP